MTREEAIEELQAIKSVYENKELGELRLMRSEVQALNMAMQALSQEPCEDAISRDAVLKIIDKWYENKSDIEDLIILITYMSSVTQKSKTGHREYNDIYDNYLCGNCKTVVMDYDNYCPNCGAKMESEDKE